MSPLARISVFAAGAMVVALSACERNVDAGDLARCRQLGGGALTSAAVTVHVGSSVLDEGRVQPGRVPSCDANPGATRTYLAAHDALSTTPVALRPERAVIHWRPRLAGGDQPASPLRAHAPSGSLLALTERAAHTGRTLWLHELAHLRMRGSRPPGWHGARFARVVEEGVADYYAAAVGGSPQVGDAALGVRDLRQPPVMTSLHWAAFALPGAPFDAHQYGWSLASRFHQAEPQPGALLEDLLACLSSADRLAGAGDGPGVIVEALAAGCPTRSRARIRRLLRDWIPEALRARTRPSDTTETNKEPHT